MKRAVAGSAARLTTAFSHLAALTDCVKNLNHLLLHYVSHSSSLSLNSLSPLIATFRIRSVFLCVSNCVVKPLCCFNTMKEDFYHCYVSYFLYLKDTQAYKWLSTMWHHINPLSPGQCVCLCLSVFPVVSASPSYIQGIVHTASAIQIHISIYHTYKLISQVSTEPIVTCCRLRESTKAQKR